MAAPSPPASPDQAVAPSVVSPAVAPLPAPQITRGPETGVIGPSLAGDALQGAFDQSYDQGGLRDRLSLELAAQRTLDSQGGILSGAKALFRGAETATEQTLAGDTQFMADTLDPSLRFSEQTTPALAKGVADTKAEISDLLNHPPEETDRYQLTEHSIKLAGLRSDLAAMEGALDRRTGQRSPTPVEEVGDWFSRRHNDIVQFYRQEMGQAPKPAPPTPQNWFQALDQRLSQPIISLTDPLHQQNYVNQLLEQFGGAAAQAMMTTGPGGPWAQLAREVAVFGGAGYQQTGEAAAAAGLSPEQQLAARQMGGVSQLPLVLTQRFVLNRLIGQELPGNVGELTKKLLLNAAVGGAGTGTQTLVNNAVAIASGIDPKRPVTQDLWQTIRDGSIVMGGLGLFHDVPSFIAAKRSNPDIVAYVSKAQRQAGEEEGGGERVPPPGPEPVTPQEAAEARTQADAELEAAVATGTARPTADAPSARRSLEPEVTTPEQDAESKPGRKGIQAMLRDLRTNLGSRFDWRIASKSQLADWHLAALQRQGIDPSQYKAFYDRDTGKWYVNPDNIENPTELQDAFVRNALPSMLSDKARVKVLSSWEQGRGDKDVDALLAHWPDSDLRTRGMWGPSSGNTYLNGGLLSDTDDPAREALLTAVHENVHQGIRSWFGNNSASYNSFLDQVYTGMLKDGAGDQIASRFGTNMEGLAKSYKWITPDQTLNDLSVQNRRNLSEELLARYSERFNVRDLDRAPSVLRKAVRIIRQKFRSHAGLNLSDAETLDILRNAWRYSDPDVAAGIAKGESPLSRIGTYYYGQVPIHDPAEDAENAAALESLTRGISSGRTRPALADGTPNTHDAVAASSARLNRFSLRNGDTIDPESIENEASGPANAAASEHYARPTDFGYWIKATNPRGLLGPYGLWPTLPDYPATEDHNYLAFGPHYGYTAATARQYAERIRLSNQFFPEGNIHYEGTFRDPRTGLEQVVTSVPEFHDRIWRSSTERERNQYFAGKGFHPIDDRTYYNPQEGVAVMDGHGDNVLTNRKTGEMAPIDIVPASVTGDLQDHFENLLANDTYEKYSRARAEDTVKRLNKDHLVNVGATPGEMEAQRLLDERIKAFMNSENRLPKSWEVYQMEDQIRDSLMDREPTSTELREIEDEMRGMADPHEVDQAETDRINGAPPASRELGEAPPARREEKEGGGMPDAILHQMQQTIAGAKTSEGVRWSSLKQIMNPDNPMAVRIAAAMPDQLLYDKVGRDFYNERVARIYKDHLGNIDTMAADLVNNRIADDGDAVVLYSHLSGDVRDMRAAALAMRDDTRVAQLDQFQANLNQWFAESGTRQAQAFSARNQVWFGADGLLARWAARVRQLNTRQIREEVGGIEGWNKVVRDTRQVLERVNNEVSTQLGNLFGRVSKSANLWLPVDYAESMANDLLSRARRSGMDPRQIGALEEVFRNFRNVMQSRMREEGILPTPQQRQKINAADTVRDAIKNWDWFSNLWDKTVKEAQTRFAGQPDLQEAFARLDDLASQLPFTQSQLARAARGQVDIDALFREHRSRVGSTVDTLSDFLTKNSQLSKDQADAVQKAVDTYLRTAVDARTAREFEAIINRAAKRQPGAAQTQMSVKRFVSLVNMGAFDDKAVGDALAPAFGLAHIDPELAARLRDHANQLEEFRQAGRKFEGEAVKLQMFRELAKWQAQNEHWLSRGGKTIQTVFMGNILSGLPTHEIALLSDFFNGMGNIYAVMMRQKGMDKFSTIPQVFRALADGFGGGFNRAAAIMRSGLDPAFNVSGYDLYTEDGNIRRVEAETPGWLSPYKYVFRSITAAHALMQSGFERPITWLTAFAQSDANLSHSQRLANADQMIYGTGADLQSARNTARSEGKAEGSLDYKLRVQELLDQRIPKDIRAIGQMYGTRTIYTQPPEGILGAAARAVQQMTRQVPGVRFIIPFTNIVANVLNESINWSPLGLARWASINGLNDYAYFRQADRSITDAQIQMLRQDMFTKALTGTALLAGVAALQTIPGPDGKPLLQINGLLGPHDWKQRQQLLAQGWSPGTLELNLSGLGIPRHLYLSYEATPISFGLGVLGGVMDGLRYDRQADAEKQTLYAISNGLHVFLDRSFLRGLKSFLDAFSGAENPADGIKNVRDIMSQWTSGVVPYAGASLASQLYQTLLDPKVYTGGPPIAGDMLRHIPFMNSLDGAKPRLNVLGEPIEVHPIVTPIPGVPVPLPVGKRFVTVGTDDARWQFLHDHNVFLSDPRAEKDHNGKPFDDAQLYDFTKARGGYLRDAIDKSRDTIDRFYQLDKRDGTSRMGDFVKTLESRATSRAKADIIHGR